MLDHIPSIATYCRAERLPQLNSLYATEVIRSHSLLIRRRHWWHWALRPVLME